MDIKDRVLDEMLSGLCCGPTVMKLGLEYLERDPDEIEKFSKSMGAFCGGLHEGLGCGALSAANALLWLVEEDPAKAHDELGPEMMAWFKERFGAWNCAELLGDDPDASRRDLCPVIVAETFLKLRDMLEDMGY